MNIVSAMTVQPPCTLEDHQQALAAIAHNEEEVAEHASGDFPVEVEPKDFNVPAARVIMKVMYAARMARPDLLRTIAFLARYLTKWTDDMDKRLHRLMVYIQNSLAYRMYAWNDQGVADGPFKLRVYSDSDFAGCSQTQRSTTGAIVFLTRSGAKIPLAYLSKRQTCVSHSTPEAEIVAMDSTIRLLALPLVQIADEVFGITKIQIMGDNKGMLCVMKSGRSPTMRHLSRSHRVSVAWLHEQHKREHFEFAYVETDSMAADMFTKSMPSPAKWTHARKSICVLASVDELADAIRTSRMTRVCHVDVVPQPQLPITVCLASVAFHAVVARPSASARVMEADTLETLTRRHAAARILRGSRIFC
jgi:hypothetical protein